MHLVVNEGDRVAQLILERIVTPDVVEVAVCIVFIFCIVTPLISCSQDLDATLRGAGGFGSTGGHTAL